MTDSHNDTANTEPVKAGLVAVLGSGIMGSAIAAIFAAAGWRVQMLARNPEAWLAVRDRVAGLIGGQNSGPVGGQAETSEVNDAPRADTLELFCTLDQFDWPRADIVIETVSEDLDLKREIYSALDELVPDHTPVATNTSGFRISEIADHCRTRNRMAHAHFFMPAHLVPLVELAGAEFTEPQTIDRMHRIFESIGRVPVRIGLDVPGLLANRLQHALMREAFSVIEKGLATPDDVDRAVRYGFGFRYVAAGPILQKEIYGLDTQLASARSISPDLCNDAQPSTVLQQTVAAGHLGVKSGQGFRPWSGPQANAELARYQALLRAAAGLLTGQQPEPDSAPSGDAHKQS